MKSTINNKNTAITKSDKNPSNKTENSLSKVNFKSEKLDNSYYTYFCDYGRDFYSGITYYFSGIYRSFFNSEILQKIQANHGRVTSTSGSSNNCFYHALISYCEKIHGIKNFGFVTGENKFEKAQSMRKIIAKAFVLVRDSKDQSLKKELETNSLFNFDKIIESLLKNKFTDGNVALFVAAFYNLDISIVSKRNGYKMSFHTKESLTNFRAMLEKCLNFKLPNLGYKKVVLAFAPGHYEWIDTNDKVVVNSESNTKPAKPLKAK